MKVLVVDDSTDKIITIKSLLQLKDRPDIEVQVSECGLEAREALSATRFDLLILDIALPLRKNDAPDRRGGINLLTEVERSNRFRKPANVIALTGFANLIGEFDSEFNNGRWSIEIFEPTDSSWRERLRAKAEYIYDSVRDAEELKYGLDLCILTALPSPELDFVRKLPWAFGAAESFDAVSFMYRGNFDCRGRSFSVSAISAPRMGMVASATLATKAIQVLRPRMLVMVGICAGIPGETELGDIVVADPAWDWQMGKYSRESFEINPDQIGIPVEVGQRFGIISEDKHSLLTAAEHFMGDKPNFMPALRIGPMASGSAVIANEEQIASVKLQNRKLMSFDMEMYGVYSAARDCSAPRPVTFGLKGVCDHADHYKNDKFQRYAAHMSAAVLQMLMERFASDIAPSDPT